MTQISSGRSKHLTQTIRALPGNQTLSQTSSSSRRDEVNKQSRITKNMGELGMIDACPGEEERGI